MDEEEIFASNFLFEFVLRDGSNFAGEEGLNPFLDVLGFSSSSVVKGESIGEELKSGISFNLVLAACIGGNSCINFGNGVVFALSQLA